MRRSVDALSLFDLADLEVAVGLVAVGAVLAEAQVVAVSFGEVAPLAVEVKGLEVEQLALQNSRDFHTGTANEAYYRTPVASRLGSNRTPIVERRTQ